MTPDFRLRVKGLHGLYDKNVTHSKTNSEGVSLGHFPLEHDADQGTQTGVEKTSTLSGNYLCFHQEIAYFKGFSGSVPEQRAQD